MQSEAGPVEGRLLRIPTKAGDVRAVEDGIALIVFAECDFSEWGADMALRVARQAGDFLLAEEPSLELRRRFQVFLIEVGEGNPISPKRIVTQDPVHSAITDVVDGRPEALVLQMGLNQSNVHEATSEGTRAGPLL